MFLRFHPMNYIPSIFVTELPPAAEDRARMKPARSLMIQDYPVDFISRQTKIPATVSHASQL
jgi:hypothetical protein